MNELKLFWDKQQINIALKLEKTLLWTFKHSESNKMLTIKIGILISLNGFKPTQLIQIIIMTKKTHRCWTVWTINPKKSKHVSWGWGHRTFTLGILKKEHTQITGLNLKRSGISGGFKENLLWNFHSSLFLILEFPRDVTQFCGISRGKSLFSPEFLKVKWQI